jgi:four helix bundle protein
LWDGQHKAVAQKIREMPFNFEKLDVYHKAIEFIDEVYLVTDEYPSGEAFGLTSQFRRAAVSISLNIAEGSARSKKDFNRFVDMARGSVFECVAILQLSARRGYLPPEKLTDLRDKLTDISKMLSGLKRSLVRETAPVNKQQ